MFTMLIPGAGEKLPEVTAAVVSSMHTTSKQLFKGTLLIKSSPYTIVNRLSLCEENTIWNNIL
jgi:hypothetical protein